MDLAVVVTHYRTPQLLTDCLERLAAFAPGVSVTVVDNASGDGTPARLRRDFPGVNVLEAPNHSMADAVNRGLKATEQAFILQMNADVLLEAATLPALLSAFDDASVAMVGPRCRTPAGTWQRQGPLYTPYYLWLELSGRERLNVPWLSGCCQMLRRSALDRVGGLDSSLRFYNEDTEWCWRLRRAGYRCELVRTSVLHIGGASTPDDVRFKLEGLRGGYILSQRYKTPAYRTLHRLLIRSYAAFVGRWGRNRAFGRSLYRMFSEERFGESPFGTTLGESNPDFLRKPGPNA